MKSIMNGLLFLLILSGCTGTTVETGPSVNLGVLAVSLHMNEQGELIANGQLAIPIALGIVNWDVAFSTVLNSSNDKSNYLIILWDDGTGNIMENDYPIGRPFDITFEHDQWVRRFKHTENGNFVVFVEKQAMTIQTFPTNPNPEAIVIPPNNEPWLYTMSSVPEHNTELSWQLKAGEVLLLTGGRISFNDFYCADDAAQICVVIFTATEDQTANFSQLITGQNWLGITSTFDSEQALSNIQPWFWEPPNCTGGCSKATIAFYIDNRRVEIRTLHK